MKKCAVCKKFKAVGKTFFKVPKDTNRMKAWSEICKIKLTPNSFICSDHFLPEKMIQMTHKAVLLPNAVPSLCLFDRLENAMQTSDRQDICCPETELSENVVFIDPMQIYYIREVHELK